MSKRYSYHSRVQFKGVGSLYQGNGVKARPTGSQGAWAVGFGVFPVRA